MEFLNIRYSPAWLADKFPGFYNEECYYIMLEFLRENYKATVIQWKAENLEALEKEEVKEEDNTAEMDSEIRSYESECEDGVQSEQFAANIESVFEFEW